ncbi:Omp28-related outer membrane protein [uncultured Porphyromonas sp.]|uniref:Omp28-related outer membrane protein n=1 Tax=uncultured Porphyromonas sp. TaxID=159274 RepID=UPI0026100572|nr:Omp28-related outer membrane protein [uncultured Porphyromonas sp.]
MKQTTTLWSLLLTLLMTVTMSTAQEPITPRLQAASAGTSLRAGETLPGFGYADRYVKNLSYLGVGQTNLYLSCYILLPEVGANKIEQISFPAVKADKEAYVLILSEDGKTTLYNQKCAIVKGDNQITLSTPFATEAGKRYLVGFATKAVGKGENDPYVIPFDGTVEIDEALYAAAGTEPYPTASSTNKTFGFLKVKGAGFGSACIFVSLKDESKLQNLGYLVGADGNFKMVTKGEKRPTELSLRNIGMNEITSFDLTYQFGTGEVKTLSQTLTTALASTKTGEYTFEIPAEVEGMGSVHFALAKVNGQKNAYADKRVDLSYKVGDFSALIDRETVILERFTSEKCGNCPGADRYVQADIDKLKAAGLRVSYIMYHSGYGTDFLTIPESEKLYGYFFPDGKSYAPAMSINRTYLPKESALVQHAALYDPKEWATKMKNDKQGVKIERIDQKISDGTLEAIVSGVALKNCFDPEDLYLTVIVTEDNIPSRSQSGANRSYKHQAVPRLFLTAPTGDKLKVEADGTFSVKLQGTLKSTWVGSQCHVVAIVHPSIKQPDRASRAVHTAETAPLGFGLANEAVAPAQAPVVTAEDGYLNILGRVDAFELYDMSGALVTTSVETRLVPGTYIIRIFSDLRVYTSKVIVR